MFVHESLEFWNLKGPRAEEPPPAATRALA